MSCVAVKIIIDRGFLLFYFVQAGEYPFRNKLAKLGDAIAISKSETMNHSLTHPLTYMGRC